MDSKKTDTGLGYLKMASNKQLQEARAEYDQKYDDAVYQMYKYLNSACVFTGEILNATIKMVQAKAALAAKGVNIFAKTPEPEPQAIGNTALVVPKVTAESDLQNRYETPLNAGVGNGGGSNGSNSSYTGENSSIASEDVQSFVNQVAQKAIQICKAHGDLPVSSLIGQMIEESGCGTSALAREQQNYLGFRSLSGWMTFNGIEDCMDWWARYFTDWDRFDWAAEAQTAWMQNHDVYEFLTIMGPHYCTEPPGYADRVMNHINTYNLTQYDGQ